MQIYPSKGSPDKWAQQTMKITAVEVDDEHDCVDGAVAYDLPAYNNQKLTDNMVPTIFVKVFGAYGTRYYTVNFFRNPFKKRTKQIDDALAGSMYQYAITSKKKTTDAYNKVAQRDRKKVQLQLFATYLIMFALFFMGMFQQITSHSFDLSLFAGIFGYQLLFILAYWGGVTFLFDLGLAIDAVIHYSKRQNYHLMFFTVAPMVFGFALLDPGMAFISFLFLVCLAVWSIIAWITKVEMPHDFVYVGEEEASAND